MANRTRLGFYLKDEEIKREIKVAAAKCGMTVTAYCAQAIEEHLIRDGEGRAKDVDRNNLLSHMDKLRQGIGPVGVSTAELIEEDQQR